MNTNQASSRRTSVGMHPILRAGLGSALLALTACSGEMDASSDGSEGEFEEGSERVDVSDVAAVPESSGLIEKATFNDGATYNGFNVGCTSNQKSLINAAQARALEILSIAGPANAAARVNRNTVKAGIFRTNFVPNGNRNPDPNRTSPDAWDEASFKAGQKMVNIGKVLSSAHHTCHADNESVIQIDGVFRTCGERSATSAVTDFVGGADNAIRWCQLGLDQNLNDRAVTLLHELTHQDRTADATGRRVLDVQNPQTLYNAQNWSSWFRNNVP